MSSKLNILVFPCGSEIALEIHRSLKYSTHFKLYGASSVDDHGKYVYENYIPDIPYHNDKHFITKIKEIVKTYKIDAIYPAMDAVADTLTQKEDELECTIIGSSRQATNICSSKLLTYKLLKDDIPVPIWFESINEITQFPVFIKPIEGYGSRNVFLANNHEEAQSFIKKTGPESSFVFCELLPGKEYTVDCFSDRHGKLLFAKARTRARISNGISVNTGETNDYQQLFSNCATAINKRLMPRGAWFFQMKVDGLGSPKLLEVAARLGGSSALYRSKGVNFALLSAFDAFNYDINVEQNDYKCELDRALSNKFKLDIRYENVYVDYDDCLLLGDALNTTLLSFLYQCLNEKKAIFLITRHAGDLKNSLEKYRIESIFDEVIHITNQGKKSTFITEKNAIFIDDSYAERSDVKIKLNIPVFAPDMIEALIK